MVLEEDAHGRRYPARYIIALAAAAALSGCAAPAVTTLPTPATPSEHPPFTARRFSDFEDKALYECLTEASAKLKALDMLYPAAAPGCQRRREIASVGRSKNTSPAEVEG